MRGYRSNSYGDAFADVYDDWYRGVSDVSATVELVRDLADEIGPAGDVLELGVGTGRLALPLAAAGLQVVGIDTSAAMLERLRAADTDGAVRVVVGDMVDDLPDGPFDVTLVAYNTLFNLLSEGRQRSCFEAVAARLAPGGAFVVEAFVPDEAVAEAPAVSLRSMTEQHVVLSVARHDWGSQRAEGQFVDLSDEGGVRLRPWSIRWATPDQLDAMAEEAGFDLANRWADMECTAFDDDSAHHVSVYRKR